MRQGLLRICVIVVFVACPCFAGVNQLVKVAVHVKSHSAEQSCDSMPPITACGDIVTTYAGFNFDAFPVFYDLTEYRGFQYGMVWPEGWGSATFTSCSDLVIGTIVNPGDGVAQVWQECQACGVGIPSFLWLHADDAGRVGVINDPVGSGWGPGIYVLDCSDGLDSPVPYSFWAGVYGAIGDNPCYPYATEPSTWGHVKALFR